MAPELYAGLALPEQAHYRQHIVIAHEGAVGFIAKIVFNHFDIPVEEIRNKSQQARIIKPTYIAMYLIRKRIKTPLKTIGKFFGGRDHSTVIHACDAVKGYIETNTGYRLTIAEIEKLIDVFID